MADSKITALASIGTGTDPANDPLVIVDVSDILPGGMSLTGTTKKVTLNNLLACSPIATLASATITGDLTVDTSTLKVDSANDRVGIGLAAGINAKLHVSSTGSVHINQRTGNNGCFTQYMDPTSSNYVGTDSGNFRVANNSGQDLLNIQQLGVFSFGDGVGGTRMTLNSTGLGVGDAPATNARLTIGSTNATGFQYALRTTGITTGRSQIYLANTSGDLVAGLEGSVAGATITGSAAYSAYIGTATSNPFYLVTGGSVKATVDSSGNVLVGTTAAAAGRLDVRRTTVGRGINYFSTASGDLAQVGLYIGKFDNDSTTSQKFIAFSINNDSAGSGQINANGANQAAFGSFSDSRLKENIVSLPSQLDNILSLRPVEFDYKDGSGHQIGFVAQEMQQVYSDAVGESDGFMTVTGWSKTEARLVSAIKELAAKVQALEAKLA